VSFLTLFGSALLCLAGQIPAPEARVHDGAGLLSANQRSKLEALSRDVEQATTAELAIVTVPSLNGKTVDEFANEWFNDWGIGKDEVNNGVLLLVAPQERRVRIEVGYGLEALLTDGKCGEILDSAVVPRFRAEDFPGGIVAGAERIADELLRNPEAAHGVAGSGPLFLRSPKQEAWVATLTAGGVSIAFLVIGFFVAMRRLYSTASFVALSLIVLAFLAVAAYFIWRLPQRNPNVTLTFGGMGAMAAAAWGFNWFKYRRFGPHHCSKCGTHLQLLGEVEDDSKLESIQRLEEKLGSVNYDVWVCPACLNSDSERYVSLFSAFSDCPSCRARTFKTDPQVVLSPATEFSAGRARVDGRCVSCNHKTVKYVVLPRIVRSSSSSGGGGFGGGGSGSGGFGGGSSGGGGASRGW
jgi:uncharacterized protein